MFKGFRALWAPAKQVVTETAAKSSERFVWGVGNVPALDCENPLKSTKVGQAWQRFSSISADDGKGTFFYPFGRVKITNTAESSSPEITTTSKPGASK